MIGNNVRVILLDAVNSTYEICDGELRKLDATGAMVYIHGMLQDPNVGLKFLPMHRIVEIIDRGRTQR